MGFTPHTKGLKMDKSILGSVTFAPAGEKVRPKVTGLKNGHDYYALLAEIQDFSKWLEQRIKYQEIEEARSGTLKEVRDKLNAIVPIGILT